MNYEDYFNFYQNYNSYGAYNENQYRGRSRWEETNSYDPFDKLKVIHTPTYKAPERIRTKIRRFELPNISLTKRINSWKVATNQKDALELYIEVEGEGKTAIPTSIATRIRNNQIVIKEEEEEIIIVRSRRVRKEVWTLKRLLWECLKESQYVEFEEITNSSI